LLCFFFSSGFFSFSSFFGGATTTAGGVFGDATVEEGVDGVGEVGLGLLGDGLLAGEGLPEEEGVVVVVTVMGLAVAGSESAGG